MKKIHTNFHIGLRTIKTVIAVMLAKIGIILLSLPINHVLAAGIGIILVITLYNTFRIRFAPVG